MRLLPGRSSQTSGVYPDNMIAKKLSTVNKLHFVYEDIDDGIKG